MRIGIFIFTSDLRFTDNNALNLLAKAVDKIIPLFIFDRTQIFKNPHNRSYFSQRAANFIIESVNSLPINTIFAENLGTFVKKSRATHVGFNEDFSPFAIKRSIKWRKMFSKLTIITCATDLFLCNYKSYYKVFGSFFKHRGHTIKPHTEKMHIMPVITRVKISCVGDNGYVSLAAKLNMGLISIREAYMTSHDKNLFWRDFHLMMYINEPNAAKFKYIDARFEKLTQKLKFRAENLKNFGRVKLDFP